MPRGGAPVRHGVTCCICGAEIPNAKGRRKYCDKCQKEIIYKRNHITKYDKATSYKDAVGQVASEARYSGSMSISDVVREAKKEGVNYGQYCVKHRLYDYEKKR